MVTPLRLFVSLSLSDSRNFAIEMRCQRAISLGIFFSTMTLLWVGLHHDAVLHIPIAIANEPATRAAHVQTAAQMMEKNGNDAMAPSTSTFNDDSAATSTAQSPTASTDTSPIVTPIKKPRKGRDTPRKRNRTPAYSNGKEPPAPADMEAALRWPERGKKLRVHNEDLEGKAGIVTASPHVPQRRTLVHDATLNVTSDATSDASRRPGYQPPHGKEQRPKLSLGDSAAQYKEASTIDVLPPMSYLRVGPSC